MKIIQEVPDVEVIRYRTVAESLRASYGNWLFTADALLSRKNRNHECLGFLDRPLSFEYEGKPSYTRTMALVELSEDVKVQEYYKALAGKGFYPASVSEGLSFLFTLRHPKVDQVFHLGTVFRDDSYTEYRLLTRKGGGVEFVAFYPNATKLKTHYNLVAIRMKK